MSGPPIPDEDETMRQSEQELPASVSAREDDAFLRERQRRRAALDAIMPDAYDELLALARRELAREYAPRSVDATTLVHESFLKLSSRVPSIADRSHLLALAAHAMRQVLIEHARSRNAAKRGGNWARITLTDGAAVADVDIEQFLSLNDAIERLEPRQRAVVECRFFAGMDDEEIAFALGITRRTVQRDWLKARAWLGRWLMESGTRG